jgi:tRNA G18 (ribose-2'-O)-methylase SpoU
MTTQTKRSTPLIEPSHPLIKRIQRLHLREERERTGLFYIEGMRFVAQALQHRAKIEHLLVCRELLTHPFAQRLVHEQKKQGMPVVEFLSLSWNVSLKCRTLKGLAQWCISAGCASKR